jgi:hypothetical protein
LQQHGAVFDQLHPFGDSLEAKGIGQTEYALKNRQVIGIVKHIVHEALINLDLGNGQAF